ncbi:polysaccharide deacetylase family protein [Paraglaciecola hydrolytica]|nr:polysaccharide deacetylase family protein [Paraglaciecola hydrolytica]
MNKLIKCISLSCLLLASFSPLAKQIAITFDDAPRPDTTYLNSAERNKHLLSALNKHDVTAMFFITTKHMQDGRDKRLLEYAQSNQLLANHSHSHISAYKIPSADFIADVAKAHQILQTYTNYHAYFRFPYLHHGDTRQKRDELRAGLTTLGLKQGYITIDDSDWYLDSLFQQAVTADIPLQLDSWREVYINHIVASANYYQQLAEKNLMQAPKQVLLLHENDLAALFMDELIQAIKKDGWEIISPLEAYQDKIANRYPDTMHNNQGRLAAVLAEKGIAPNSMIQRSQRPEALKKQLENLGLIPVSE